MSTKKLVMMFVMVLGMFSIHAIADGTRDVAERQWSNAQQTSDPYESLNRAVYAFNRTLDVYILKPVATVYNIAVPIVLQTGITNFFNNIDLLPTIANDVLQANFSQAGRDITRIVVNSTIGIVGLFDVAKDMHLVDHHEDFGLTLAKWGYKQSTYLVLPFWGPATVRDTIGMPIDYFGFSLYPHIHPTSIRYGLYGLNVVVKRAHLLTYQDVIRVLSIDEYVFVRNAYLQHRLAQIQQNEETLGEQHLSIHQQLSHHHSVAHLQVDQRISEQ